MRQCLLFSRLVYRTPFLARPGLDLSFFPRCPARIGQCGEKGLDKQLGVGPVVQEHTRTNTHRRTALMAAQGSVNKQKLGVQGGTGRADGGVDRHSAHGKDTFQ